MSKAIKCDRCGEFEPIGSELFTSQADLSLYQYKSMEWVMSDLCKNCREQLSIWFKDKSIIIPKTPILDQARKERELEQSLENNYIDELAPLLSTKAFNILCKIGFKSLADIKREFSIEKLRKCRGVGPKIEAEILDALKQCDIELPETDDDHDNLHIWFMKRAGSMKDQ